MSVQFVRVMVTSSFEKVLDGGSKLLYRAGHFYHVTEEHALEFAARGLAKAEGVLEAEAKQAEEAAAADAAKAADPAADVHPEPPE